MIQILKKYTLLMRMKIIHDVITPFAKSNNIKKIILEDLVDGVAQI